MHKIILTGKNQRLRVKCSTFVDTVTPITKESGPKDPSMMICLPIRVAPQSPKLGLE